MIPPAELDDGDPYPERAIFREILAPWSKGRITYDDWYDRPIDDAFRLADRIIDDAEKARAAAEEARGRRR